MIYYRYLDENIRRHVRNPRPNLKEDDKFIESNKMHGEAKILKHKHSLDSHGITIIR